MPDTLPSVLSTESEASGKTFAFMYSSVTPQTWPNEVSTSRAGRRGNVGKMSAAHKPSSAGARAAGGAVQVERG